MNRIFLSFIFLAGLSLEAGSVSLSGLDELRISGGALNSQPALEHETAPGLDEHAAGNVARAALNHPLPTLHNVRHMIDGYDLNHEIEVIAGASKQSDIMAWSVRVDGAHAIDGRQLAETGAKSNLATSKTGNEVDIGGERNEYYDDGISVVLSKIFGD